MPSSRATEPDAGADPRTAPASTTGPAPADAGTRRGTVSSDEIERVRAELTAADDRHLRARADLENYRRRSVAETDRRVEEARDRVELDWLDVRDSVERALRHDPDGPGAEGLRAVLGQIDAVLTRHGVMRSGAAGERFDPDRHEAIGSQTSADTPRGAILDVARAGFARGDRTLRPAQVVVSEGDGPP